MMGGGEQVVDEADRLLRQAYQEWLPQVLAAISPQVMLHLPHNTPGHNKLKTFRAF